MQRTSVSKSTAWVVKMIQTGLLNLFPFSFPRNLFLMCFVGSFRTRKALLGILGRHSYNTLFCRNMWLPSNLSKGICKYICCCCFPGVLSLSRLWNLRLGKVGKQASRWRHRTIWRQLSTIPQQLPAFLRDGLHNGKRIEITNCGTVDEPDEEQRNSAAPRPWVLRMDANPFRIIYKNCWFGFDRRLSQCHIGMVLWWCSCGSRNQASAGSEPNVAEIGQKRIGKDKTI